MDYGVSLKKRFGNPSRRSRQHVRQSRFEGSQRQVRGAVLSALVNGRPATAAELERIVSDPEGRVRQVAAALCREGLVEKKGQTYRISG
jgi:A/G-specific adenine glycosylase